MRKLIAVALLTTALGLSPPELKAQANLPPSVRADVLLAQINSALTAGDFSKALSGMDEYRTLGIPIAPSVLYLEARAAVAANDLARAKRVFEQYLAAGQSDPSYQAAINLYTSILPYAQAAETEIKKAADAAAAKAKSEADAARDALVAAFTDAQATYAEKLSCEGCPPMIVIPAGSYQRGVGGLAGRVTVSKPFAIGKYEVTFAEWDQCVRAKGCKYKPADWGWGRGKQPVINVSWEETQEFIRWMNRGGEKFRLPSETEWEIAAKAGTTAAIPPSPQPGYGNCPTCGAISNAHRFGHQIAGPVGLYPANAWGLHDVIGNVWEWVGDCWHNNYAAGPADGSAWQVQCELPGKGVIRGGSYSKSGSNLDLRSFLEPIRDVTVGFRLARELE